MVAPLNVASDCIERIAKGDLTSKITQSYPGDYDTLMSCINTLVDNLARFAQEVQDPADQVAYKLGYAKWRRLYPALKSLR